MQHDKLQLKFHLCVSIIQTTHVRRNPITFHLSLSTDRAENTLPNIILVLEPNILTHIGFYSTDVLALAEHTNVDQLKVWHSSHSPNQFSWYLLHLQHSTGIWGTHNKTSLVELIIELIITVSLGSFLWQQQSHPTIQDSPDTHRWIKLTASLMNLIANKAHWT